MSNLLNAANTNPDGFIVGELPVKSGDVSIMTLKQLQVALAGLTNEFGIHKYDPGKDSGSSVYYVYAINDCSRTNDSEYNSTLLNLQEVGLDWYRELNKPTKRNDRWINAGKGLHNVFGGPLSLVGSYAYDRCYFHWFSSDYCHTYRSDDIFYWDMAVSAFVRVAVVHS